MRLTSRSSQRAEQGREHTFEHHSRFPIGGFIDGEDIRIQLKTHDTWYRLGEDINSASKPFYVYDQVSRIWLSPSEVDYNDIRIPKDGLKALVIRRENVPYTAHPMDGVLAMARDTEERRGAAQSPPPSPSSPSVASGGATAAPQPSSASQSREIEPPANSSPHQTEETDEVIDLCSDSDEVLSISSSVTLPRKRSRSRSMVIDISSSDYPPRKRSRSRSPSVVSISSSDSTPVSIRTESETRDVQEGEENLVSFLARVIGEWLDEMASNTDPRARVVHTMLEGIIRGLTLSLSSSSAVLTVINNNAPEHEQISVSFLARVIGEWLDEMASDPDPRARASHAILERTIQGVAQSL